MSTYLDNLETMTKPERGTYQDNRLAQMVRLGYERSARLRKIFDERGLNPSDIRSVKELAKLPVINRERARGN